MRTVIACQSMLIMRALGYEIKIEGIEVYFFIMLFFIWLWSDLRDLLR